MRKVQLGCGGMALDGWENYDLDVDIRKPLPFPDGSVDRIFAEHALEHVTHREAWSFLEECWRALRPGGGVRLAIPDVHRIWRHCHERRGAWRAYLEAVRRGSGGDGSVKSAVRAAVFEHGHQAAWTAELLWVFLKAAGFEASIWEPGESSCLHFQGVEQHGKAVGEEVARLETSAVEGWKP